jgi:hypothetical protein
LASIVIATRAKEEKTKPFVFVLIVIFMVGNSISKLNQDTTQKYPVRNQLKIHSSCVCIGVSNILVLITVFALYNTIFSSKPC